MAEDTYSTEYGPGPEALPLGAAVCPIEASALTYDTDAWKCATWQHAFRLFLSGARIVYRPTRLYHPGVTAKIAISNETVNVSEGTVTPRTLATVVDEVVQVSEAANLKLN